MEYVIGPVLALLLGLKYSHYTGNKNKELIDALKSKVENTEEVAISLSSRMTTAENIINVIDKQTLSKMVTTIQPVASAIKDIQAFVGMK